jgi:hypothetical protein
MTWLSLGLVAFAAFVIGGIAMWCLVSKMFGLRPW